MLFPVKPLGCITRLLPDDPSAFYNLACSYSLLEQTEKAFEALELAAAKGYSDAAYMLEDPDLSAIRKDPRFEELLRRIARE